MESRSVRKLKLSIFGDFTLKFEASKGLGKLPKLYVTTTACEQNIIRKWGKAGLENFLTEGFALEDDALFGPVPHRKGVVRRTAKTNHLVARARELAVSVGKLGPLSENAV